jgi:hypothetical protein
MGKCCMRHACSARDAAHRSSRDADFLDLDDCRGNGGRAQVTVVVLPLITL